MKISDLSSEERWLCWRNADGTKRPVSPLGGPGSSTDQRTWSTHDVASGFSSLTGCDGVGLVIHGEDGIIGIDLDDCIDADGRINDWAQDVISAIGSYTERSPSGSGVHIIVHCPGSPQRGFSRNLDGHKVEVYPRGRFLTYTGQAVSPAEINSIQPGVISALFGKWSDTTSAPTEEVVRGIDPSSSDIDLARMYLETIEPAVSGSGGHNTTYRAAHKLVIEFGLDEDTAFDLLCEWNRKCSPPWTEREMRHKIRSAISRGDYSRFREAIREPTPVNPITEEELEFAASLEARLDRNPLPEWLMDLPGTMGLFADWVVSQNHRKSRQIGMVAAIALQALLVSRRICDASGTRTNLYVVGLAPSSGGKQAALDCVRAVVDASGDSTRIAGKMTSDAGIASQLRKSPASLFLLDEFGLFLQGTHRHGPAKSIQEGLLDLWGAGRTTWRGKAYADSDKEVQVVQPCLSIMGMSTPGHFWSGLTRQHMRDGFAGRMLVIDTGPRAQRGPVIDSAPPRAVMEGVAYLDRISLGGNLADAGYGMPRPRVVPSTCAADEMFDGFHDECDSYTGDEEASVWGRAPEKARKLALIYASASSMIVDERAATWAIFLSRWATKSFMARAETMVSGGSDRQGEVMREVGAALMESGSCTFSQLARRTGAQTRMLDEVLQTMEAAGRVEVRKGARGRRVYLKGGA